MRRLQKEGGDLESRRGYIINSRPARAVARSCFGIKKKKKGGRGAGIYSTFNIVIEEIKSTSTAMNFKIT